MADTWATCNLGEIGTQASRPKAALAQMFLELEARLIHEPRFADDPIYIEQRQARALEALSRGAARACVDHGDVRTPWRIIRAILTMESLVFEGWRLGDPAFSGWRVGATVHPEALALLLTASRYYAGRKWPCLATRIPYGLDVDVLARGTCGARSPSGACAKSSISVCGSLWSGTVEGWQC